LKTNGKNNEEFDRERENHHANEGVAPGTPSIHTN